MKQSLQKHQLKRHEYISGLNKYSIFRQFFAWLSHNAQFSRATRTSCLTCRHANLNGPLKMSMSKSKNKAKITLKYLQFGHENLIFFQIFNFSAKIQYFRFLILAQKFNFFIFSISAQEFNFSWILKKKIFPFFFENFSTLNYWRTDGQIFFQPTHYFFLTSHWSIIKNRRSFWSSEKMWWRHSFF